HPGQRYRAGDPTGGYPFVLKEVYEWMLFHPDLVPGEAAPDRPAPRKARGGAERRISGPQPSPRSESDIRVNFFDPSRIISASNDIAASGRQGVYYSSDGGATWGQTSLPLLAGDFFHSDPTVDWTSDGTAWSTTIGINASASALHMRAYKSTDGGATWSFDATFSGTQTSTDKQMVWVDHSATSPFKDSVYAIWHNDFPVFVNRRLPGGAWQTPLQVSGAETLGTGIGADVKTNANGDVFAFWPDTGDSNVPGSQKIYFIKSTNGGAAWSAPVALTPTFGAFVIGVPAFNDRQALIYISAGAYRTATKDLVYAVWTDLSGAAGCNLPANEPGTNTASACKTRIWFARSADGGATWAAPVKLNDPASANDQFNPWLTVDETNGTLGVIYYDTAVDPGRKKTGVYYQSSFDDGVTWASPIQVTAAPTDETAGGADSGNQYGDYNSLSGFATKFFPSWTDRRGNQKEEIWTAKIDDVPCSSTGAPVIGAATAPAAHQVQVTWANGAPSSARFNVYRARGTCASPGAFQPVASSVTGTSYLDTTVSGTLSYAYQVTGIDVTGFCESPPSGCTEVVATGSCTEAPVFPGIQAVTSGNTASCGLSLSWAAATPVCASPLTYKVYRGTSPGFVPGPANLVASGVTGSSFTDTDLLNSSTTYSYVVHAVDSGNSAEEGNTAVKSGSPTAAPALGTLSENFEGGLGSLGGGFDTPGWSHAALSGGVDWVWNSSRSQTPSHSWYSASQGSAADRVLVSPPFTAQAGTTLSFWHTFSFEGTVAQCYDAGTLEITTDGGSHWGPLPGGIFNAGGFNGTAGGTAGTAAGNPIGGERAWCAGTLGAMTQVRADLGSFAGLPARLRWHAGDDSVIGLPGWYVDSVTLANAVVSGACAPGPSAALDFYTLPPCRLVDTRNPAGPAGGPALAAAAQRTFSLSGLCGVPATARALSVNVTVVGPMAAGDLRLFPADQSTPNATTLNFAAGQTRTNNAILGLAWSAGTATVQNDSAGTVDLIVDVNGYYR
ncbi:MAG: xanthomonalisin, partial [Acidobacteriota bacterium]|nr:xanthomonalisin [Acidobacteriota bacterium]